MRREKLEHLVISGRIKGKQDKMLDRLRKWLNIDVRDALKMMRD